MTTRSRAELRRELQRMVAELAEILVQRRLTHLRQRFGVDTTADLRGLFTEWGFEALA